MGTIQVVSGMAIPLKKVRARSEIRIVIDALEVDQTALIPIGNTPIGAILRRVSTTAKNAMKGAGRKYSVRTLLDRDPPCIGVWRLA